MSGFKITQDQLEAHGVPWPLDGYDDAAFRDADGLIDIDAALASVRSSLALWEGEYAAAARMTAMASRGPSFLDYEDMKDSRQELGARCGRLRRLAAALARVRAAVDG